MYKWSVDQEPWLALDSYTISLILIYNCQLGILHSGETFVFQARDKFESLLSFDLLLNITCRKSVRMKSPQSLLICGINLSKPQRKQIIK
jgi:hypothetical protein